MTREIQERGGSNALEANLPLFKPPKQKLHPIEKNLLLVSTSLSTAHSLTSRPNIVIPYRVFHSIFPSFYLSTFLQTT